MKDLNKVVFNTVVAQECDMLSRIYSEGSSYRSVPEMGPKGWLEPVCSVDREIYDWLVSSTASDEVELDAADDLWDRKFHK